MSALDDALLTRAIEDRRTCIEERDRLQAELDALPVAPSPDAPGLREAVIREAVIHAARDVNGLWFPQDDNDDGTDLTFWGPEAGEALRDLRDAIDALDAHEETPR